MQKGKMSIQDAMVELDKFLESGKDIPQNERLLQGKQELEEFATVLTLLDSREIALEIGLCYGGSHFFWRQFFSKVISIEWSESHCIKADERLAQYGCDMNGTVIIMGDSSKQATVESVKRNIGDRGIDFLFIDGSHTSQGLAQDFANYYPLVRNGGIIAIHDAGSESREYLPPVGPTEFFKAVHDYVKGLDSQSDILNISKFRFIQHDHTGIAWCIKWGVLN